MLAGCLPKLELKAEASVSSGGCDQATSDDACSPCPGGCELGKACIEAECVACGMVTFSQQTRKGGLESLNSTMADLDRDGFVDLVWTNQLDETATIFWGDGTTQLGTPPRPSRSGGLGRTSHSGT
jgi:hypothetical protein